VDRLFYTPLSVYLSELNGGITRPYENHAWVFACVNAIAMNIAGVPLNFFTGFKANKLQIEDGDLPKLFETPNPMMGGSQLIEATKIFMGLTGEAMWILDRASGREVPREIWTFHPQRFEEDIDEKTGLITGWKYRKGKKEIPLADYEVVFFKYFNP
jgi:phage portal protein BeeE